MILLKSRRNREKIIVKAMIEIYCYSIHQSNNILCRDCQLLCDYSDKRLCSCVYGDKKPVCKNCPIHCYSPQMREKMRQVMRFSGPRMVYRKPLYTIIHTFDNLTSSKLNHHIENQKK